MRAAALVALISAAGPLAAEPFLDLPLDCVLGQTCFIEDFVDRDPGPGVIDYAGGLRARDGHRGTDFALPTLQAMDAGVAVLAAAPGTVAATRDGVPDRVMTSQAAVTGTECGNGVRILHAEGLQTLYCHLAQGSIRVAEGMQVAAGQPLGTVGLSGETTFPHLHFSVLDAEGRAIDPFQPDADTRDTLWTAPPDYDPTGFFTAGFSTAVPTLETVQSGAARAAEAAPTDALVLYAHLFHADAGDVLHFTAHGPDGAVFEHRETLDRGRAQQFRAFGRRAPDAGWPAGAYRGQVTLTRGDTLIGARQAYTTIVD